MGNLDKQLRIFSPKERVEIEDLIERILKRDLMGLNCKKLKGFRNFFRVRKEKIRIIFELIGDKEPNIMIIERRNEDTYKL